MVAHPNQSHDIFQDQKKVAINSFAIGYWSSSNSFKIGCQTLGKHMHEDLFLEMEAIIINFRWNKPPQRLACVHC
jgi:hypothetical protein